MASPLIKAHTFPPCESVLLSRPRRRNVGPNAVSDHLELSNGCLSKIIILKVVRAELLLHLR